MKKDLLIIEKNTRDSTVIGWKPVGALAIFPSGKKIAFLAEDRKDLGDYTSEKLMRLLSSDIVYSHEDMEFVGLSKC